MKTAFLHGLIDEEIYMSQPGESFTLHKKKVCLVKKALYGFGLKQSLLILERSLRRLNREPLLQFIHYTIGVQENLILVSIQRT